MRRVKSAGAVWHVFARGCRRLPLFRDSADYCQMLSIMAYALRKSGCVLYAYCLMSNHYHFVLYGSSEQLRKFMIRVNRMYSRYHNERYHLSGTAFEAPYKSYIQASNYLIKCRIAYVLLNPVAAGMVTSVESYRWSSHGPYLTGEFTPIPVDASPILSLFSADPSVARLEFAKFLRTRPTHADHSKDPSWLLVAREHYEWMLDEAAVRVRGTNEDAVVVALHWARQCGLPERSLSEVLGIEDTSRIRQRLCRFRKQLAESPELANRFRLP